MVALAVIACWLVFRLSLLWGISFLIKIDTPRRGVMYVIEAFQTFFLYLHLKNISCRQNIAGFLSLRVFGLLSSSLLLFPQRFGWYVLRPSSGVCRTREPSRNFELRPLLNPRGSLDTWRNGYRCWFPKVLRRQSSGGCRFNPDCRRVTIQEYLSFVPGYN